MRRRCSAIALVLGLASAEDARADERTACLDAHVEGQRAEQAGELQRATALYAQCTLPACPAVIRKDCSLWRERSDRATPTVILRVRDARGHDVAGAVHVDGQLIAEGARGRPLPLNPGVHRVHVTGRDGRDASMTVMAVSGEKDRLVDVVLDAPTRTEAPARPPREPILHWAPLTLATLGVGGIATFAAVGLGARATDHDLETTCAPRCDPSRVDDLRARYLVADVSLAVGAVALVAAGVWLTLRATSSSATSSPSAEGFTRLRF